MGKSVDKLHSGGIFFVLIVYLLVIIITGNSAREISMEQLLNKNLLTFADILIRKDVNPNGTKKEKEISLFTNHSPVFQIIRDSSDVHASISSESSQIIYIAHASNFKEAVEILIEILPNSKNNWIYIILLSEKLPSLERVLELLEEDNDQTEILTRNLSILSIVLILEEFQYNRSSHQNITALDIYALKRKLRWEYFSVHLPLNRRQLASIYRRRHFHEETLRVVAMATEARNKHQISYAYDENKKPRLDGGYEVVVVRFLAKALNFTTEAVLGSGFLGNPFEGKARGMAQQIENDEADISISLTEMFAERHEYLTFLMPTYESRIYAFIKKESSNALRNVFFQAFDSNIWILLLSMWALLGFSLVIMAKLRMGLEADEYTGLNDNSNDTNISEEAFLWAMGTLCQQGWHITPSSISMRIIIIAGQVTAVLCYIAFGAALVSILSADENPLHNTDDLARFGYKFYCDFGTYRTTFVLKSIENRPSSELLPPHKLISVEDAYSVLEKTHVAFLALQDILYPILRNLIRSTTVSDGEIDDRICTKYSAVPANWAPVPCGMFIKKNSPMQAFLNQKIILMTERGLKRRYFGYYYRRSVVHCPQSQSNVDPLELRDVWSSFLLLAIGFIPSLLFLIYERVHVHIK